MNKKQLNIIILIFLPFCFSFFNLLQKHYLIDYVYIISIIFILIRYYINRIYVKR